MKIRIALAALLLAFATIGASALAAPAARRVEQVVQRADLHVTREVHTWNSRPIAGKVVIRVYVGKRELPQTVVAPDGCSGTYTGRGVVVGVRLLHCASPAFNPIRFDYVTLAHPRDIRVVVRGEGQPDQAR